MKPTTSGRRRSGVGNIFVLKEYFVGLNTGQLQFEEYAYRYYLLLVLPFVAQCLVAIGFVHIMYGQSPEHSWKVVALLCSLTALNYSNLMNLCRIENSDSN